MKLQDREFFRRDVLCVAPELVGRILVRRLPDGTLLRARITETEAYRGEQDTACHASRGTEVLYHDGGTIYVYLCYGMHWMLNIVTGHADEPQAVLIRACADGANGPGKLQSGCRSTRRSTTATSSPVRSSGSRTTGSASRSRPTPASASAMPRRRIRRGSGAGNAAHRRRHHDLHTGYPA